jgi:hypothetical protein
MKRDNSPLNFPDVAIGFHDAQWLLSIANLNSKKKKKKTGGNEVSRYRLSVALEWIGIGIG